MKIRKEKRDLFTVDSDFYLVHCISSDFELGAGIAREFAKRGVKDALFNKYPFLAWNDEGYCLYTEIDGFKGVFNLVTKKRYYLKPTYETLEQALLHLKRHLFFSPDDTPLKIAMPLIGCGLDKLKWEKVEEIIHKTFDDFDVEIIVCYL